MKFEMPYYKCEVNMMIEPKVSVIVPIYNAEKTLSRCLDSIIKQTYINKEIILINDGSTDTSENICVEYCELFPSILVINQKNAGPATARNTGIEFAKGKYVYFVDADDYIESDTLEQMVSIAEKHKVDMVICGYYQENDKKMLAHKYRYAPGLYIGEKVYNIAKELISDVSETRIPPYSWVRMIRRDVLDNPKLRFPDDIVRSEDYYFNVQLHFRIRSLYLLANKPLYHYMEVNDSVTHSYVNDYWGGKNNLFRIVEKPSQIA